MAYGPLALRPWELARITPREYLALVEGWRWRDDHVKQLLAFSLTFLVNPHLKKPVSFDKVYHALIGQAEVARRKAVDHKEIVRGRRRLAAARRDDGKRR